MRAAILALVAATAFAGQAQAQAQPGPGDGPPPGAPRGRLYISPAGEPFRGGDGLRAWFAGADANHDGALTPEEFRADAERFFKVLDRDGNGGLRGLELQAYEREVAPEIVGPYAVGGGPGDGRPREGWGGDGPPEMRRHDGGSRVKGGGGRRGPGGGAGGGREGAARFSLLNIPQPVTGSDLDGDRKVTLDEWTRTARIRFDLLDKAGAGRLTLDALAPSGEARGTAQGTVPQPR